MQSASEIQLMIRAASGMGGLSRDALMSLGSLARGLDDLKLQQEDVIAKIEPYDEEDLRRLDKLDEGLKSASYLD